jgi:DNA-binding NtrC family response regulator
VVLLENDTSVLGRHLRFLEEQTEKDDRPSSDKLSLALPEEGMSLEEIEKKIILQAYEKCGRNKSKTARFLKLPRHVLIYRLKKYDIEN